MNVDILAVGAHPDDVELACSGTLLRHIAHGYSVGLLDLTLGELGTRGDATTRSAEASNAATKLGAAFRQQLNLGDGFFQPTEGALKQVIQQIRNCQPKIILANAPSDRHPDHGRASSLVRQAAFLSGLRRIETVDAQGEPQLPWRPESTYFYIQDNWVNPDFVIDITTYFPSKIELILCFRTQFYDPMSDAPETPISGKDFLAFIEARARDLGRPAGYTFAEGFVTDRFPGIRNFFDLD
jgi:bacillithiol biosynthesis deacetylase BshB1